MWLKNSPGGLQRSRFVSAEGPRQQPELETVVALAYVRFLVLGEAVEAHHQWSLVLLFGRGIGFLLLAVLPFARPMTPAPWVLGAHLAALYRHLVEGVLLVEAPLVCATRLPRL